MSEHDMDYEEIDEAVDYGFEEDLDEGRETISRSQQKEELYKRLRMSDIRTKQEFLAKPGFEMKLGEDGTLKRRPNKALRDMFATVWDNSDESAGAARSIFLEMEAVAAFYDSFNWDDHRPTGEEDVEEAVTIPTITKEDEEFLADQDKPLEPTGPYRMGEIGGWVSHDPIQKLYHEKDEVDRANHDLLMFELNRKTGKSRQVVDEGALRRHQDAAYNGALDVDYREALDTQLPRYPDLDGQNAVQEGLILTDSLRQTRWRKYLWDVIVDGEPKKVGPYGGLCAWLRYFGRVGEGSYDLNTRYEATDNLRHFTWAAPKSDAKPTIMIEHISIVNGFFGGGEADNSPVKTDMGWGWVSEKGKFSPFRTDRFIDKIEERLVRLASAKATLLPSLYGGTCGLVEFFGPGTKPVKFETRKILVEAFGMRVEVRSSSCSHCSRRISERGDAYWNMLNSFNKKLGCYATQYVNTGDYGANTPFVLDTLDYTAQQRKLLGDAMFDSPDTWEIKGKSGDWRCLLCGRTKFFRVEWATVAFRNSYRHKERWTGFSEKHKRKIRWNSSILGYRTVKFTVRLAGENFLDALRKNHLKRS